MTDRIRHLTITLDRDYREDDVQVVVEAIRQLRAVSSVELHAVTANDHLARMVAKNELGRRIYEAVDTVLREDNKR